MKPFRCTIIPSYLSQPAKYVIGSLLISGIIATQAFSATRGESIVVTNNTGQDQVIYFMIDFPAIPSSAKTAYSKLVYPCIYPSDPFSGDGNDQTCHFSLPNGKSQTMPLTLLPAGKVILAISAGKSHFPKGPCNTTLAEITLNDGGTDGYDISLVNGRSFDIQIAPTTGQTITLSSQDPRKTLGVFPIGCSRCVDNIGVAPNFEGNGTTTQNCPGYGRPPGPMPAGSCKTGGEFTPVPNNCQIDSVPTGGNYTVTFTPASS